MNKEKQSLRLKKDGEIAKENEPAHKKAGNPLVEKEVGGRKGPEPTRYGDWELSGKCVDF